LDSFRNKYYCYNTLQLLSGASDTSSIIHFPAICQCPYSLSAIFSLEHPSNSIWPHLSYGLVRSKREYYHNCSLVVYCVAFCSCTVIWAAHRFCLPDLASSHWVHSLCLSYFACVRLFSCIMSACMLYYCNTVRWAWLDWGLSGWLTTVLQCFDTVGWVISPVKTVGRITYIVLVQTYNHAQSINQIIRALLALVAFVSLLQVKAYGE